MLKIISPDYSILGQHSRESTVFSKKYRIQLTSLGHAGSPCFLSYCYLPCIVLTCSILGSVYLKSTVNLQKCSNHSCSILGSVYLKSTRLTRKNALINAVVSRLMYTECIPKKCITLTYLTYEGDNLIQLLTFFNIMANLEFSLTPSYFFSTHSKLILARMLP